MGLTHELARGCWSTCTCGFNSPDLFTLVDHFDTENLLTDSEERSKVEA